MVYASSLTMTQVCWSAQVLDQGVNYAAYLPPPPRCPPPRCRCPSWPWHRYAEPGWAIRVSIRVRVPSRVLDQGVNYVAYLPPPPPPSRCPPPHPPTPPHRPHRMRRQGARSGCQLCCLSATSCDYLQRPSGSSDLWPDIQKCAKVLFFKVYRLVRSFLSSDTILASYWSSTEQMWIPIGSSNAIEKVRTRSNFVIKKWKQDFFKVESINLNFVSLVLSSEHGASPPQSCLLISDYRNLTMTMMIMMRTLGVTGGWVHSVDSAQQLKRSQSAYLSPVTGRLNWNGKWWRWWSMMMSMVIMMIMIMQHISKSGIYRTQVNLGSDLWVRMSVRPSQTDVCKT